MPDPLDNPQPADANAQGQPAPPDPNTPPALGEATDAQTVVVNGLAGPAALAGFGAPTLWGMGGGPSFGMGGTSANPCGFPGWGGVYGSQYWTYDWMLQHPVIRHARGVVCAPIEAGSWVCESGDPARLPPDDPGTSAVIDYVQRVFDRLRPAFMPEALRCLDYGWAPFEPIWDVRDGYYTIDRLKPLAVERTWPLRDRHGNVIGLRNNGFGAPDLTGFAAAPDESKDNPDLLVAERKALVITYDGRAGDPFGRPRLESIRQTAWMMWLDCAQQINALSGKISGRQAFAIVPSGGYTDPKTNTFRTHQQDAADGATAFAQGKTPIFTSLALNVSDPQLQAKLAAIPLIQFQTIDYGSETPAISGMLDRMRHAEELMFMGYLRSPRSGMEAQTSGSRADSESHTDSGMLDSQLVGNLIPGQLQRLVDDLCYLNWGLPPGTVRIKQSPLVDDKKQTLNDLVKSMGFSPDFQRALELCIDWDRTLDTLEIPRRADADQAMQQILDMVRQQQEQQMAMAAAKEKAKGGDDKGDAGGKEDKKAA
jgi:hypothetical protein